MQVVEADRDARLGHCRDHIVRIVGHVHLGHFEIARLEPVGALVEHQRIQFGKHRDQLGDRVIRQMRIGDMPLRPLHFEPDVDRTAATDLHHIAQPVDAGGFTDEAQIGLVPRFAHEVDQRAGAVERGAFLVAGDDEADRAGLGRHLGNRVDHTGDRALHVDRAAAIKQVAAHFWVERLAGPAATRRHHVEMAGKGEVLRAFGPAADREEVLHRRFGRARRAFSTGEPRHLEAERSQHRFHRIEHRAGGRSNAGRGHQPLGEIENLGHRAFSSGSGPGSTARSRYSAMRRPACSTRRRAIGTERAISSCDKATSRGNSPSHGSQPKVSG